jgi:hypothetical protein
MSTLKLFVERLVLDGVPLGPGDGQRVRSAMELELTDLLTADGLHPSHVADRFSRVSKAPAVVLSHNGTPSDWGKQIAKAVHTSLSSPSQTAIGAKK